MKDSSPDHHQMSFMSAGLMDQLNPKHPLLHLARTIPWDFFESEFAPLYAALGRPANPRLKNYNGYWMKMPISIRCIF